VSVLAREVLLACRSAVAAQSVVLNAMGTCASYARAVEAEAAALEAGVSRA